MKHKTRQSIVKALLNEGWLPTDNSEVFIHPFNPAAERQIFLLYGLWSFVERPRTSIPFAR